jgi:hypothetical protein
MRLAICLLTVFLFLGNATVRADEGIWGALVLATNEQPAKPVPRQLEPFAAGLSSVFGYNSFYLLGAKQERIRRGDEEWIVPTKKVFLKMRCLDRSESGYRVQIELFVEKKSVVRTEVKLPSGAPLYIRGPSWGRGRLIFILEAR